MGTDQVVSCRIDVQVVRVDKSDEGVRVEEEAVDDGIKAGEKFVAVSKGADVGSWILDYQPSYYAA